MKRLLLGLLFSICAASSAQAVTFGFDCLAGPSAACGVGEAQIRVEVTDAGSGMVNLVFTNTGAEVSAVRSIYFDRPENFAKLVLLGGAGTRFKKGGKPKDLPGVPSFMSDFRFTARSPQDINGLNPGESLTIVLKLASGRTFADVVSALESGSLKIGVFMVANTPTTGEASLVNLPRPVPEPVAALMGGVACLGLALLGRRR
ncbi:MAG: hypothetical protein FJ091_03265 [Deltaproteobacteria bacterium]|nr:hypothetical protein [Deltaproteobacteria bacterium]